MAITDNRYNAIKSFYDFTQDEREELGDSLNPLNLPPAESGCNEQLATVTHAAYGCTGRDDESPGLTLSVEMLAGGASLSFFAWRADLLIHLAKVDNVARLKGRPCVVRSKGIGSTVEFVRWK